MASALSFITSNGKEVILNNYDQERNVWELWGRTGFVAPALEYVDEQYADGYVETLAVRIPPRDVTLNLVVHGSSMLGRDRVLHNIVNQIFEHGIKQSWGKLKVQRKDGTLVYLNCFYSGGLESQAEEDPFTHLLSISFHAPDPYFYDFTPTEFYFTDTEQDGLYLSDETYLGNITYLSGGVMSSETIVDNAGQIAYPVITVTGPAKNIKFENLLNGAKIEFADGFELLLGDVLEIDCRDRRRGIWRTRDGVKTDITNTLRLGASLVFALATGKNNIKITYTDTTAATSVNFSFQRRWLSA